MEPNSLPVSMPIPLERLGPRRDPRAEAAELRAMRKGFGLTQVQMAQVLDISHAKYHRWESGKKLCDFSAIELMRCWAREASASGTKKRPRQR
jgi:DNA-binding transcriptional regulator YiaG